MNPSSNARAASVLCLATVLASCGGGGDDSAPQLTGTQGSAAAYRGVWRTDCGLQGPQVRGVKFVLNVTGATGNKASGRLTTSVFYDARACTDGLAPLETTHQDLTLTIDPTAVNVTGDFTGTADKVTVSAPGTAPSIQYFGFLRDMSGFYVSFSNKFNNSDLPFKRSAS